MKKALFASVVALTFAAVASAQTPRAPRAPGWAPTDISGIDFSPKVEADETPLSTLFASPVLEQTPVSRPNIIEFSSVDHNATDAGTAVITSYDVTLFAVGSSTPAKPAVNIGKPALAGGVVSYTSFSTVWSGLPAGQYNATVTAKGPGGAATGPLSATPFSVDPRAGAAPGAPTFRQ